MATDYRELARQAARRYGVDPHIFERQIGVESAGYDPNVISGRRSSPAGAQGIAQIMPATARGWHVNPLDPQAALNAAAKNMAAYVKQYGNYENALRAYNAGPGAIQASHGYAETNNYVSRILNGRNPTSLGTPVRGGGGGGATPQDNSVAQAVDPGVMTRQTNDPGSTVDASSLIQLSSQRKQAATGAGNLPTPAAMAGPALPAGYQALSSGQAPKARQDIGALISASRTPGQAVATVAAANDPLVAEASADTATGPGKGLGSPGATGGAQAALQWAQSKLGSHETGTNSGGLASYLNQRFGMSNAPWCAMFTSAAVTKGGAPSSARTASVAEVRRQAQQGGGGYQRGFVSANNARAGDLILFENRHIGMVKSVKNGRINYVGGNQSDAVTEASVPIGGGDIVRPRYGARKR